MTFSLVDFKRPNRDNGRGINLAPIAAWPEAHGAIDRWIAVLQELGIRWVRVLDDQASSVELCRKLSAVGIFPVVRLLRRDSEPDDGPQWNPGHLGAAEEETVKRLIDAGVLYFETNSEPNRPSEWKSGAFPADRDEAAKLVALNWLFDARVILDAGGYPGLPAISVGGSMDLLGALAALGHQQILLEGCWIALHNFPLNRPLDYPGDPVNQTGAPVLPTDFDQGPLTEWAWSDLRSGRANSADEVNQLRAAGKNPGATILQDHACFREYEYYFSQSQKYLGNPIPLLTTEGGPLIGRREDLRFPRMSPRLHAETTCAIFDHMQRKAPDYYFAYMPNFLLPVEGREQDAWFGSFWQEAFHNGTRVKAPIPHAAVESFDPGAELPVISAIKALPSIARIGAMLQPAAPVRPAPPPPPRGVVSRKYRAQRGDTLSSIAKRFGTTVTAIVTANDIADPGQLSVGDELVIPRVPTASAIDSEGAKKEKSHIVEAGDTLATLAYRYDTTISAIVMANDLTDPNSIKVGQSLSIPVLANTVEREPRTLAPAPPTRARPTPPPPRPRGVAQFDPRLGALGIGFSHAMVVPGVVFWKLIDIEYLDPAKSSGEANLICTVLDQNGEAVGGQRVLTSAMGAQSFAYTDSVGTASLPLEVAYWPERGEAGQYSAWVDGLPGDHVTGLGRPHEQLVSFHITWQKSIK